MNNERIEQLFREIFEANGMTYDANARRVRNRQANSVPSIQQQLKELLDTQTEWEEATPGSFATHIQNHWDHTIREKIKELLPDSTSENQTRIAFLYQHYSFFKNTLTKVVQKNRSRQEAEIKAIWIINKYQNYVINDVLPSPEEFFLQQHMFGTPQQWMDLCDSLQDLYEGEPSAYIQHMLALTS